VSGADVFVSKVSLPLETAPFGALSRVGSRLRRPECAGGTQRSMMIPAKSSLARQSLVRREAECTEADQPDSPRCGGKQASLSVLVSRSLFGSNSRWSTI